LKDITLDTKYCDICGYTQEDLEIVFKEHLKNANFDKIKSWYNGYNFIGEKVYNPYDILLFIDNDFVFNNYWFQTGTPSFLIKLIKKYNYFIPSFEKLEVTNSIIDSFDIEEIELEPILFQTGYLTIKEVKHKSIGVNYILSYPNLETKYSFNNYIIKYLTNQTTEAIKYQSQIYDYLEAGDLEKFKQTLISLFASLPYESYVKNNIQSFEGYYANVIYSFLASSGVEIIAEDVTNHGRIDLTLKINKHIYIIEYKVDNPGKAIEQIKTKKYYEKYLELKNQGWEMFLLGIDFDSEKALPSSSIETQVSL